MALFQVECPSRSALGVYPKVRGSMGFSSPTVEKERLPFALFSLAVKGVRKEVPSSFFLSYQIGSRFLLKQRPHGIQRLLQG